MQNRRTDDGNGSAIVFIGTEPFPLPYDALPLNCLSGVRMSYLFRIFDRCHENPAVFKQLLYDFLEIRKHRFRPHHGMSLQDKIVPHPLMLITFQENLAIDLSDGMLEIQRTA